MVNRMVMADALVLESGAIDEAPGNTKISREGKRRRISGDVLLDRQEPHFRSGLFDAS